MIFFRKLMLVTTALTLSFAVHTANYYFYNNGRIDGKGSDEFIDDAEKYNEDVLDYIFPDVEELIIPNDSSTSDSTSESRPVDEPKPADVPINMTYSSKDFAKFTGTYLKETADAGEKYFDDILFCGDSLTYALGLDARFLKNYDVLAWGGLGVYDYLDFNERAAYNQSTEIKKPIEWIQEINPSRIYLMMGTNGIAVYPNEKHIELYGKMLDRIEAAVPDAEIVLVGIPPWGSWKNTETFNPQKFDNFNMMLLEMAKERGMYYLNFNEVTRDENGNFRSDLCSDDGIHWLKSCKYLYLEYIRTHAIP